MITINRVEAHRIAVNACNGRVLNFVNDIKGAIKAAALLGNFSKDIKIPSFLDQQQIKETMETLGEVGFETVLVGGYLYIYWD